MDDELKLVTKLRNRAINKRAKGHYSPSTIALEDEAASAILALRQRAEQAERERELERDEARKELALYKALHPPILRGTGKDNVAENNAENTALERK